MTQVPRPSGLERRSAGEVFRKRHAKLADISEKFNKSYIVMISWVKLIKYKMALLDCYHLLFTKPVTAVLMVYDPGVSKL